MPLGDDHNHEHVYRHTGISREIPTDPFAYFQCKFCGESFKVRRSNLERIFPGEDMSDVYKELDRNG